MNDIKCIEEYSTRLKILPVCDCGYVFEDGIILRKNISETSFKEEKIIKYPEYSIEPNFCPNCKRIIECVQYDRNIIYE